MPDIELRRLTLRGFGPFTELQKWQLSGPAGLVHLAGRNLVEPELEGNGVGKTSLFDALTFALTGKTSESVRGPDLVTWDYDGGAVLTLEFAVDGWAHTLERTIRPNSLTIQARGNRERIIEQPFIDDLLGRKFEAYLASVHHAQNIASFLDKGPTAQLDLLSELLDLEVYERAADVASDWAKKEQKTIGDINVNVAGKRGQLFTLEQQEDKLEVREMTYLRKRVRFLLECDNQIAGWRKQLQIDQRKLDDVNSKIENVDEKEVKEEKRISEEAAHTLARVSAESHLLRTRRAQLVTALRETYRCPTCGRLFEDSERAVNHAEKELNRVDSELKELDEKIRELRARNEQATKHFLNLSKEINAELERLRQYRKTHETAITTARTSIEQLQKQRRDFQSGDNPFTADTADVADEINCIRNAIERKMFALDSAIGREASLAFWSKGFKDLRLSVVEMALAHLTIEVNNKLDQLGLPNWRLAVEAEGITKTGNIRRGMRIAVLIDGIERPMGRVSQGSRQRLRIAVMLGIADMIEYATGGRFNIELFDEPTAWLSKSGVTALLTVLQDRARLRNRRIYLADHRSYAFPVDDRLTVVRRRDGATIERG